MTHLLVGYHCAKTGGSTLSGHIRSSLGEEAIVSLGTASRVHRFFDGERLIEELTPGDFAAARLVYGHGVDETTLHHVPPGREVDFVFITRDPVKHYKSRMVHATQSRQRFRTEVDVQVRMEGSPVATNLCARFPTFIADDAGTLEEKAISILHCFRFILSTDRLNDQMPDVMRWLGAPPEIAARRVRNTATLSLAPELEARIAAECAVDGRINDTVMSGSWDASSESLNAFGFDPRRRDQALSRLRDLRPRPEAIVEQGYAALVKALRAQGCLHAALAFLDAGKANVGSPQELRARVLRAIGGKEISPKERLQRADVLLKLGDLAAARQDVETFDAAAPLGVEGHRIAARVHLRAGYPGRAREHTLAALRIAPGDARTQALHRRTEGIAATVVAIANRLAALARTARPAPAYSSPSARNEQ